MDMKNAVFSRESCRVANSAVLAENNQSVTLKFNVKAAGLYKMRFCYKHYDWDQWIKLEIGNGDESLCYQPSLPHGHESAEIYVALFGGENTVKITHAFGHELFLQDVSVSENPVPTFYELVPKSACFYGDCPRKIHAVVKCFGETVKSVKCGEIDVPFTSAPITGGKQDPNYSGYDLFMSDLFLDFSSLKIPEGKHSVTVTLESGKQLELSVEVFEKYQKAPLKIISFDVGHANSSLVALPNGKYMMVDSGYESNCRKTVLPYLERSGIKVDYYLLTHYHSDHYGALEDILAQNCIKKPSIAEAFDYITADRAERYAYLKNYGYLDSSMLCTYDKIDEIWDLGGVELTALCSRFDENGKPYGIDFYGDIAFNEHNYENGTSVSLLLRYGKFGYYHGADNYAYMQQKNLDDFKKMGITEKLRCQYFFANHHFHVDVNPEFIHTVNPENVYVPGDHSIYSRAAYATDYINDVVLADYPEKRLKNTLILGEIGTAVIEAENSGEYRLTTYKNGEDIL